MAVWRGPASWCLGLARKALLGRVSLLGRAWLRWDCWGGRRDALERLLAPAQPAKTVSNSCNLKYMYVFVFHLCF